MKFIFSFLFAFIFILPALADNQCTNLTPYTTCINIAGCIWNNDGEECSQCQSGTYSAVNDTACHECATDSDYLAILNDQTKQHPAGASSCSDWECVDDYFPVDTNGDGTPDECSACDPTTLPDNAEFTDSCNWRCKQRFYKNGNTCNACPTNSTTPAPGATSISQCTCIGEFYMNANNECIACPSNTAQCAGLSYQTVTCESRYIKSVSNDGMVTCSPCPEHAVQSGNTCVCAIGYYGDGNTCTACPAGMTSPQGATTKSACQMTANTNFCDANGENCMKLLPTGITINQ